MHVDRICRLEHGVYNLARVRDAATSRYARFQIPSEWMQQDTGVVSQVSSVPSIHSLTCRGAVAASSRSNLLVVVVLQGEFCILDNKEKSRPWNIFAAVRHLHTCPRVTYV
jgi:hypothetical protein